MIQGLTHFSALKMKLLEARKVLRLAGQTKCPVYPGESLYVGVLILQSLLFYLTLSPKYCTSLWSGPQLFALTHTARHPPPPTKCKSFAVDPRAAEQRQI